MQSRSRRRRRWRSVCTLKASNETIRARRAAAQEKSSGLYHTPTRPCNLPQVTHFKQFPAVLCLTLPKPGSYTLMMTSPRVSAAALVVTALAVALPLTLRAQPITRSMYVSVVDAAGAPVPDLGPSDFVVREDNATREVLTVVPAEEPMQIALLVDTSQGARNNIQFMRSAL